MEITNSLLMPFNSITLSAFCIEKALEGIPSFSKDSVVFIPFLMVINSTLSGIVKNENNLDG